MQSTRASGATTVVISTTSEISHSPYCCHLHRAGSQPGDALLPGGADGHQGQGGSQEEQDQRAEIERQRQQRADRAGCDAVPASQRRQRARAPGGNGGMI